MKIFPLVLPQKVFTTMTTVSFSTSAFGADIERRDVTFQSEGLACAGWYYIPKGLKQEEKHPVIVMAHGYSSVKEMNLNKFAEKFAKAGFAVLVFDYRYFGASQGEPRGQLYYYEQIEDYRNAITWVSLQKEVDPERIGVWGTSFSGGHVLCLSALDRRVKVVVAQCPFTGVENMQASVAATSSWFAQNRKDEYVNNATNYIPVVDSTDKFAALAQKESYEWFTKTTKLRAPNWQNKITVKSIEKTIEYTPKIYVPLISPTPLLMLIAGSDVVTPTQDQKMTFDLAKEPKKLVVIQCGHYDAYQGENFQKFCEPAVEWFRQYLKP